MTPTATPEVERDLSVEERVQNGMTFLDERVPGWRERIDVARLELDDPDGCILGQLDWPSRTDPGSFEECERLGLLSRTGDYDTLTAAWKSALERSSP